MNRWSFLVERGIGADGNALLLELPEGSMWTGWYHAPLPQIGAKVNDYAKPTAHQDCAAPSKEPTAFEVVDHCHWAYEHAGVKMLGVTVHLAHLKPSYWVAHLDNEPRVRLLVAQTELELFAVIEQLIADDVVHHVRVVEVTETRWDVINRNGRDPADVPELDSQPSWTVCVNSPSSIWSITP